LDIAIKNWHNKHGKNFFGCQDETKKILLFKQALTPFKTLNRRTGKF